MRESGNAMMSPIQRILALAFLAPSLLGATPPDPYVKRSTWQETILASVEAVEAANLPDGFPSFESETLRGGEPGKQIRVALHDAKEMYLFATGCPDQKWGIADWANATLTTKDGVTTSLTALKRFRVLKGRHEIDLTLRSGLYQKMSLGGHKYEHGLNVQADSVIVVPLDGQYESFEAVIGIDDWAKTNGTVRFSVVGPKAAAIKRLWERLEEDFPGPLNRRQMVWEREDRVFEMDKWTGNWPQLAQRYADACSRVPSLQAAARLLVPSTDSGQKLEQVRELYYLSRQLNESLAAAQAFDFEGLEQALTDLQTSFPKRYPTHFLSRFHELQKALKKVQPEAQSGNVDSLKKLAGLIDALTEFKQTALLANPLLDFKNLVIMKRQPIGNARRSDWEGYGYGEYLGVPRQSSWNYGTMPVVDKWTNEIALVSPVAPTGKVSTIYKPASPFLVADIDLHWDAERMLFSMPDTNRNWQIHEIRADGSQPRQLTPSVHLDVHNYDPTYLPSGEIIFLSTAPLQGVPCNAGVIVGMMYKMGENGERIRQLTFEQDHDYTPSVLNNGRVLYLRWDYTDTPHVWNRLLMSMNPDGTGQMEYYGANSYWPNAIFFARAIPNEPSKIVGIVTGHHEGRVGELFILDPAKGRHEIQGVVQRIPKKGPPVEARIEDKLTEHSWPKFLHPWPLSDKYFLVACKPEPSSLWGIYLVDVFDNMVLIKEEEGFALLEPIPLRKREAPPVLQDRVQPASKDALVYMEDVYSGPGLRGIPRGTVKKLRLFTYHFGYQKLAGIDHRVGADGPWEAKRVLGTVPVEADGSALFSVPAKMPLSFQPLDAEGKAVALMRSWMTAMPGESVACVGCHDRQSSAPPPANRRMALARSPSTITPWPGPPRGFSFAHDVQPVLDKYCVGCHDGKPVQGGKTIPDLRRDQGAYIVYRGGELDGKRIEGQSKQELLGKYGAVFDPSYVVLRQFIRVGGLESDLHLLPPKEFHADTSELVQMLQKGHHQVKLDQDAWDRLVTWIDLNAPCHGRWADVTKIPGNQCERRLALRKLYDGITENWEEMPDLETDYDLPTPIVPEPGGEPPVEQIQLPGWPLNTEQARKRQAEDAPIRRTIALGGGLSLNLVRIPAGRFVMGDASGELDERPPGVVTIASAFWMAEQEVSNEQFAQFDPTHESRFEHRSSWIFDEEYLGWRLDKARQPVVRVSWQEVMAFCDWLGAKLGEKVTLPTEAQWEYACRAGTDTPLNYGDLDTDFSPFANLGDSSLRRLADEGWRPKSPDLIPKESRFNDGALVTEEVGRYQPNAWGLRDMHGNAAEWTRSNYRAYPFQAEDGRDKAGSSEKKVVRGGSWRDRPKYCRSAYRQAYPSYQKVYNVGFRIVIEPAVGSSTGRLSMSPTSPAPP